MIKYTSGNLFDADVEALVNTVNEVGVMGKGIALMFREAFPENTKLYERACKNGEVRVGKMFVTQNVDMHGPKWIINFPTKKHWRQPSKLSWIEEGLSDLVRVLKKHRIKSVAIPPLGCGAGGLEWSQVKGLIDSALADVPDVAAVVFQPTGKYQNAPKRAGVRELTPARAMIAELIRRYAILGNEGTNLEVQKLAWFLNRTIERLGVTNPLGLRFMANKFGPYADQLRHLLNQMDGSYLSCEKRLSDAGPMDPIRFNDELIDDVSKYVALELPEDYRVALDYTTCIIDGFESPLGMELLATVDWLVSQENCPPDVPSVKAGVAGWMGGKTAAKRKLKMFDDRLITVALNRLKAMSGPIATAQ